MDFNDPTTYLWISLAVLIVGSIYLIIEGYKVTNFLRNPLWANWLRRLWRFFNRIIFTGGCQLRFCLLLPKRHDSVLPIVLLWIVSLVFAIFAVQSAKREVTSLINK